MQHAGNKSLINHARPNERGIYIETGIDAIASGASPNKARPMLPRELRVFKFRERRAEYLPAASTIRLYVAGRRNIGKVASAGVSRSFRSLKWASVARRRHQRKNRGAKAEERILSSRSRGKIASNIYLRRRVTKGWHSPCARARQPERGRVCLKECERQVESSNHPSSDLTLRSEWLFERESRGNKEIRSGNLLFISFASLP